MKHRVQLESPKIFPVLGVPVHLLHNYSGWLLSRAQQQLGAHVVTLNAEMTMQAEDNPRLASVIHQADLVIPDGSGIVLYLMLQGQHMQRCPGIELAESLLHQFAAFPELGSVFFFGGAPGVAERVADEWQQRSPGLNIAGTHHGYLTPELDRSLQQTLRKLQPRLILVGLGVPRQEFWIAEHRHLCPHAIWIGVGGSLDIWAGVKTRAPEWLRNNHMEWVYRLYKEPWRWRRMLALPKFAWRALVYRLTQREPVSSQG